MKKVFARQSHARVDIGVGAQLNGPVVVKSADGVAILSIPSRGKDYRFVTRSLISGRRIACLVRRQNQRRQI
jgi:hypothetical protein